MWFYQNLLEFSYNSIQFLHLHGSLREIASAAPTCGISMSRFSSDPQEMDRGVLKKRWVQIGFKDTSISFQNMYKIKHMIESFCIVFFFSFGDFSRISDVFWIRETTVNIETILSMFSMQPFELSQFSYPFSKLARSAIAGSSDRRCPSWHGLFWSFESQPTSGSWPDLKGSIFGKWFRNRSRAFTLLSAINVYCIYMIYLYISL